jgi:hypothetical protein
VDAANRGVTISERVSTEWQPIRLP